MLLFLSKRIDVRHYCPINYKMQMSVFCNTGVHCLYCTFRDIPCYCNLGQQMAARITALQWTGGSGLQRSDAEAVTVAFVKKSLYKICNSMD